MLAYNPEKENMTEDEREHLLSTVGQAHAGLSEVALKLRVPSAWYRSSALVTSSVIASYTSEMPSLALCIRVRVSASIFLDRREV